MSRLGCGAELGVEDFDFQDCEETSDYVKMDH